MDQQEFEKKLSEVAEWEWRRVQGSAGPSARNVEDGENPLELHVKKLKDRPCPYHADKVNCHFNIKPHQYGGKTHVVQRCHCATGITPAGHVVRDLNGNIGAIVSMVDRGIKEDQVIQYADGSKPKPKVFVVSDDIAERIEDDTGIITKFHE